MSLETWLGERAGRPPMWRAATAGLTLAVSAVLVSMLGVGCVLSRGGTLEQQCTADVECPAANPCQRGVCDPSGFCRVENVTEIEQVAGDCQQVACADGEVQTTVDTADRPDDVICETAYSCTDDGELASTAVEEGAVCSFEDKEGTCEGGRCEITCQLDGDCPSRDPGEPDNPCRRPRCNLVENRCVYDPIDTDGTELPADLQTPDDCKINRCVMGVLTPTNDDDDRPADTDCTEYQCNGGNLVVNQDDPGTSCPLAMSKQGVCDGMGTCVECVGPTDCAGTDTFCQQRTCMNNTCGVNNTAAGTPVLNQFSGDCQVVQCNGAGMAVSVDDNNDAPMDTPCQVGVCNSGTPGFNNKPNSTPCGAMGLCNNGVCSNCVQPSDCGTDTFCQTWQCNGGNCSSNDQPNGTVLPMAQQMTGDCTVLVCQNGLVSQQDDNGDVPDDMNECTDGQCNAGQPSNVNRGPTETCNGGTQFCNGMGACVDCNFNSQCSLGDDICESDVCQMNNTCTVVDDPVGALAPPGQQEPGDCKDKVCDGNGEIASMPQANTGDVPDDMNECTSDSCVGATPTFTDLASGTPCNMSMGVCDGAGMCVGCVNDNECGTCEFCDNGTCVQADVGTDPGNDCSVPGDAGPDCGGGGTCMCGADTTPSGGGCPGVCDRCEMGNTVCVIECTEVNLGSNPCSGDTKNCPSGKACVIECVGNNACDGATLNCNGTHGCDVVCDGNNACKNADVNCSSRGSCGVTCVSGGPGSQCDAITMNCGDDDCELECLNTPGQVTQTCNDACSCAKPGCP